MKIASPRSGRMAGFAVRAALAAAALAMAPAMAQPIKIGIITDKVGPAKPYAEPRVPSSPPRSSTPRAASWAARSNC